MVQGREEKISFKGRKTRQRPKGEWIVVKDTHEAIIEAAVFQAVQDMRRNRCKSNRKNKQTGLYRYFKEEKK